MEYEGRVEDIDDPLKIGRVRVRVFGIHSQNQALIPTESLPWAVIKNSPDNPAKDGYGKSPVGLHVGSVVTVEFRDGEDMQQPVVTGSYTGVGDVPSSIDSRNSQNNSLTFGSFGAEPETNASPETLKNKIYKSDTGIIIECDDTDGRLRIYHPSGSLEELMPSGDRVSRTAGNDFKIVNGKRVVVTKGDDYLDVYGQKVDFISGNLTEDVTGNILKTVGGNEFKNVAGNLTEVISGLKNVQANLIELQSATSTNIASTVSNSLVAPTTSIISSTISIGSPSGNSLLANISALAQEMINLTTHIIAHTHPTGVVNTGVPNNNSDFLQDESEMTGTKTLLDELQ